MSRIYAVALLLSCCLSSASQVQNRDQQPVLESPRLVALERELKSGNAGALDAFWTEITKSGTPLVETIPGDQRYVLVTFIWRGDKSTQNVVIVDGPAGEDYVNNQLVPLAGTDLWYKVYKLRSDARFYYEFSVNDPLTAARDDKSWSQRFNALKSDPLNHHLITWPNAEQAPSSPLELPNAAPQPWITPHPGVPAGRVEVQHLKSAILANERRIWVYTPAAYNPRAKTYRLLVLFDGDIYSRVIPTPTILDNLIAETRIPAVVAVLVEKMAPAPGGSNECVNSPEFAKFVADELVPWIRQNYSVSHNATQSVVGGLSCGGETAAYVALRHPELFGNVLSQSGAFQHSGEIETGFAVDPQERNDEWLAQQYVASSHLPLRFYLESGLYEHFGQFEGPTLLEANRHMRDVLRAKGYEVKYSEFPGDHDELYWRGTLADGLIYLIANH